MTAPDRPAVTEEEIREAALAYNERDGYLFNNYSKVDAFIAGARFALAACASQSKSRLARYDEAVRLLHVGLLSDPDWHEARAFLAAEPKTEKRFPLEEVAPEEAQRRYLKSMKTEERNG